MPSVQRFLSRALNGSLSMPGRVLGIILTDGWASWPMETGGILLGRRTDHSWSADVVHVIGAGPHARHERYGFKPDTTWQAEQVAAAWADDNSLEYLGDWHTHPAGTTKFSALDLAAARTITEAPLARQPNPVMMVAALRADLSSQFGAGVLVNGRLRTLSLAVDPL